MYISKSFEQLTISAIIISTICLMLSHQADGQSLVPLDDLSSFQDPGESWKIVGNVTADLANSNVFEYSKGTGILLNIPDEERHGSDLFTKREYGDIDLELEYMMALGSNSGIYLQGRYELQLEDTWGASNPTSANNGGIYEYWDDSHPEGYQGYGGHPPRQNASRAPGLWQNLKISFQAPRFNDSGKKIENARILQVKLNGVIVQDNVELLASTRGAIDKQEKATGPLRFQGDHGAVAFRNIKITNYDKPRPKDDEAERRNQIYPILIDAPINKVVHSFMDLAGGKRLVHAVSVGSPQQVHYTYDMDSGMIVQVWRGGFLNATPMWHSRGDGSSRPVGAVQGFGEPVPAIAKLSSPQAAWPTNNLGSGYRPKGYVLDKHGRPQFRYLTEDVSVLDASKALPDGRGISREITVKGSSEDLYIRLAEGNTIGEISDGMYLIDKSFYLRIDKAQEAKPIVRNVNGGRELIMPLHGEIGYTILF